MPATHRRRDRFSGTDDIGCKIGYTSVQCKASGSNLPSARLDRPVHAKTVDDGAEAIGPCRRTQRDADVAALAQCLQHTGRLVRVGDVQAQRKSRKFRPAGMVPLGQVDDGLADAQAGANNLAGTAGRQELWLAAGLRRQLEQHLGAEGVTIKGQGIGAQAGKINDWYRLHESRRIDKERIDGPPSNLHAIDGKEIGPRLPAWRSAGIRGSRCPPFFD